MRTLALNEMTASLV